MLVGRDQETRPVATADRGRARSVRACSSSTSSARSALGPVELQNRIVSTAHQTTLVHDHLPTDDFVAYHEARARGGAGLIVLEATAPHPSGILTAHELAGYLPEIAAAYRRVGDAVQPHGTRLFVQLLHGGREQIAGPPRAPALAPSAIPSQRFRVTPRALRARRDRGDRRRASATPRGSRRRAASTASRSPPRTATSSRSSSTPSSTGATTSGPSRRASCSRSCAPCARRRPGSASACASRPTPSPPGGWRRSSRDEVDYLSIALGESPSYLGSTLIVPPPPMPDGAIVPHAEPFRVGLPLIATSRVVDVGEADAIVASGAADALGMTRALITDPDLPTKARAGRMHEIIRCIGCQACIAHYHADDAIRCAINPRTGPRADLARAGAGGAATAPWSWSAPGRRVSRPQPRRSPPVTRSSCSTGRSGSAGSSRSPRGRPGARAIAEGFLANHERTLDAGRAPPRHRGDGGLGRRARAGRGRRRHRRAALRARPAARAATSARPGTCSPARFPPGSRVVVADWGGDPAGLDAAEVLAAAGNEVTLAVASVTVGESVHQYRRNLYLQRLYRAGVTILHAPRAGRRRSAARRGCATSSRPSWRRRSPADVARARARPRPRGHARAALRAAGLRGRGGGRLPLAAVARGGGARGSARRRSAPPLGSPPILTVRSNRRSAEVPRDRPRAAQPTSAS